MASSHSFSLSVGGLVGKTLGVYLRNLVPFTLLGALVLLPWIALRISMGSMAPDPWMPFVSMLLQSLLTYVLTGAVTYGVVQQLREQPAGLALVISKGLSSFLRVLGTGLLCGVRILLWSFLLLVPGIIESVRLYVAIPAAIMEAKSGGAAIERSKSLTRGSGWPIFGAWLLMFLIGFGLAMLGFFLLRGATPDIENPPAWLDIGIALLVNPLSATMMAVAYFMLRQGKENVDPKKIAAVFD